MSKMLRTTLPGVPMAPGGNYVQKVAALQATLTPGKIVDIDIRHDSWCRIYKGKPCNCDPEIVVNGEILPNGKISRGYRG